MKKILICSVTLFCFFLAVAGLTFAAETLYVSATGAKLKSDKSASSDTVAELAVGTVLTVKSYENRWYNVATEDGKKGWIYRGKVSEDKPESESSGGGLFGDMGSSSIQASASDTSRSMRGLSPEAKAYADQKGTPEEQQKALDDMLSIQIQQNEIETFMKNGDIGEYAQ